jgi:hypothetical protein
MIPNLVRLGYPSQVPSQAGPDPASRTCDPLLRQWGRPVSAGTAHLRARRAGSDGQDDLAVLADRSLLRPVRCQRPVRTRTGRPGGRSGAPAGRPQGSLRRTSPVELGTAAPFEHRPQGLQSLHDPVGTRDLTLLSGARRTLFLWRPFVRVIVAAWNHSSGWVACPTLRTWRGCGPYRLSDRRPLHPGDRPDHAGPAVPARRLPVGRGGQPASAAPSRAGKRGLTEAGPTAGVRSARRCDLGWC